MHAVAAQLGAAADRADTVFAELFLTNPNAVVFRLFALYNMNVLGDPEKAAALEAEAERVALQRRRELERLQAMAGDDGGGHKFTFRFFSEMPAALCVPASQGCSGYRLGMTHTSVHETHLRPQCLPFVFRHCRLEDAVSARVPNLVVRDT